MEERKAKKKRKLGSYPFVSVVFSITVALLVLGLFGWIILNTASLGSEIRDNVEIQVYLNKDVAQADISKLQSTLAAKKYTLARPVPQVTFVSREAAAEQFTKETGENFRQFLGDNPLRDLFTVKIAGGYQISDSLQVIKNEIEGIYGVYEVDFQESLIEEINQNLLEVGLILLAVAAVALLAVVISINNTIKLALFSQRFLIRSMQLVGATNTFIQKPFIVRATLYGLLAGFLACFGIYGFSHFLNSNIVDLSVLQDDMGLLILFLVVIFIGVSVGFLSSYRAIRKYLKMSLDELY